MHYVVTDIFLECHFILMRCETLYYLMPVINSTEWDTFLTPFVDAHLLQTPAWGALKADFGWESTWLVAGNSVGAQVLFRKLPFGYKVALFQKGQLVMNQQSSHN